MFHFQSPRDSQAREEGCQGAVQSPCLEAGINWLAEALSYPMWSPGLGCLDEISVEVSWGLIQGDFFDCSVMEAELGEGPAGPSICLPVEWRTRLVCERQPDRCPHSPTLLLLSAGHRALCQGLTSSGGCGDITVCPEDSIHSGTRISTFDCHRRRGGVIFLCLAVIIFLSEYCTHISCSQ